MREQSHLEAMREAVRGDIERARERRPSIFERPSQPPVEIRAALEPVAASAPEPEPAVEPKPEAAPPATNPNPRWAFWRR